ncbi:Endonuclease/Exonuclease/phosphatase family protein [Aphelenchoides avenae]|nr:Endonuclease/Exonuclease/phosphatase family protein [Aphelenchus avenae]
MEEPEDIEEAIERVEEEEKKEAEKVRRKSVASVQTVHGAHNTDLTNDDFHSQFSEEEFQKELHDRPNVVGPGGIFMPRQYELEEMVDGDSITVMCFTWNINCKPASGLRRLNEVFAKIPPQERPDLIAVALQELPTSTFKFHHQMVGILGEALETTHRVYCWVRKWSQMLIIFIRKRLSLYTSHPEYRFVATSRVAKPFRTKGAIGICFRILQTSIVFIACHLTHGKLKRRILDYHKLSKAFDFQGIRRHPANKHSSETQSVLDQMKNAANVFWFGDLNFRVAKTKESEGLGKRLEDRLFRKALDYEAILLHDELSLEIAKGLVFEGFREPVIKFPPTHKFINGTNRYAHHRVPSYTVSTRKACRAAL